MPEISGLAGIRIGMYSESRVFLRQFLHGIAELVLIRFCFWLDRHGNYRRRKINVFQNDRFLFIAQRIAGGHTLETHAGRDVSRMNGVDILAFVGMHPQQSAHALARLLGRVVNIAARLQHAGICPDVGHVPDKRVGHDF